MNILVTAGNTQTPIDHVRCITNIFTGRTGAAIALQAWQRGHHVHLLTSHPEVVPTLASELSDFPDECWKVTPYRTFDDLERLLADEVPGKKHDAIFHAAAVSDYIAKGIYAPAAGTTFAESEARWSAENGAPALVDRAAGKIKSDEPELWLRLVRAPKLVDRFREPWGFRGMLVKFKLEVGMSYAELQTIAETSRVQSQADYIVANTLEEASEWAMVGPIMGNYGCVVRNELPGVLIGLAEAFEGA